MAKVGDSKLQAKRNHGVIITCEHAGNRIPPELRARFADHRALLGTHRGYDPGALDVARTLATRLKAPLFFETMSRLVVDQNRSRTARAVFSPITGALSPEERTRLLQTIYDPYHQKIEETLRAATKERALVFHFAIHSFTPVLHGKVRNADIGLLYDPSRKPEKKFAARLKARLLEDLPGIRVRYNYPYRGTSDGLTTMLRKRFSASRYVGLEIEINLGLFLERSPLWTKIGHVLPEAINSTLVSVDRPSSTL